MTHQLQRRVRADEHIRALRYDTVGALRRRLRILFGWQLFTRSTWFVVGRSVLARLTRIPFR